MSRSYIKTILFSLPVKFRAKRGNKYKSFNYKKPGVLLSIQIQSVIISCIIRIFGKYVLS